jgi:hypothetical protein
MATCDLKFSFFEKLNKSKYREYINESLIKAGFNLNKSIKIVCDKTNDVIHYSQGDTK